MVAVAVVGRGCAAARAAPQHRLRLRLLSLGLALVLAGALARATSDAQAPASPSTTNERAHAHDGGGGGGGLTRLRSAALEAAAAVPARLDRHACWAEVVARFPHCEALSEDGMHRFALALANCFFRKHGMPVLACADSDAGDVTECTRAMDGVQQQVLSTFFTYADTYCSRAMGDSLQLRTAASIGALFEAVRGAEDEMHALVDGTTTMTHLVTDGVDALHTLTQESRTQHEQLARFAASSEQHFARTARTLDGLAQQSAQIESSVGATAVASEALARSHAALADSHRAMAQQSAASFDALRSASAALGAGLAHNTALQADIVREQERAADALRTVHTEQARLGALVSDSLAGQRELLALQHEHAESAAQWHARTSAQVGALESSASHVSEQLNSTARTSAELLAQQHAARNELRRLVSEQHAAFQDTQHGLLALANTSNTLLGAFDAVAGQVSALRSTVLGEFFDVKAVAFYALATTLALLLTAASATADARLPLLLLLAAGLALEKTLLAYAHILLGRTDDALATAVWLLRRALLAAGALVLAATTVRRVRSSADSARLLNDIRGRQADIDARLVHIEETQVGVRVAIDALHEMLAATLKHVQQLQAHANPAEVNRTPRPRRLSSDARASSRTPAEPRRSTTPDDVSQLVLPGASGGVGGDGPRRRSRNLAQ